MRDCSLLALVEGNQPWVAQFLQSFFRDLTRIRSNPHSRMFSNFAYPIHPSCDLSRYRPPRPIQQSLTDQGNIRVQVQWFPLSQAP